MTDQTSTVQLRTTSAATDNTVVRVDLAAGTTADARALWFGALPLPEKKGRKGYVEKKLRKMGR